MSARETHLRNARPGARARGLKVVRAKKRGLIKRGKSRRMAPVVVIGIILSAATIFGVLLEQVVLAQTGFKMAQLRDDMAKAEAEHAKLVLKAAKLSSSERIERVAIEELGMVSPSDVRYIVANIKTRRDQFLAQEQTPQLSPGSGTAAAELGGLSP